MHIQSYNRSQLLEFIHSDFYKNLEKIPISNHRALSHIHNPVCGDDDILLWVAYEENRMIGYIGALPDLCRINETPEKIYWLSCFWVDEAFRLKNTAASLFFLLMSRYKDRLFVSNIVPDLEKTYQSLRIFHPTVYKSGYRVYVRFCLKDLIGKHFPKTAIFSPVLKLFDAVGNVFLSGVTSFFKPPACDLSVMEDTCFDDRFQSFIEKHNQQECIKRDAGQFSWIISYPWVIQGIPDEESRKYYFSSKSLQFHYCSLKFYKEERLSGYCLLKIRDNAMWVSYVYADDNAMSDISSYLLNKARTEKLNMITVFDDNLKDSFVRHKKRYLFSKTIRRPYIITKGMNTSDLYFQEGDGDAVFT
ncbi:MAG: GNAT family N-acetyltransferase [Candidatus Azobacteroides sp.]|nr:GNAT family N-acetyltransferase [Candidatus Azobacteroides sp.]